MEKKKIYPDFTYTQYLYLLSRLFDRVFSVNTDLLYIYYKDKYNKQYDIPKVELCYSVYVKLCLYYGYNCTMDPFFIMTGLDKNTLHEWLTSGRSRLQLTMLENAKNNTLARFENSRNPILSIAAANYKYQLQTPEQAREAVVAVDVLPDLLALADNTKKALPEGPPGNCT